MTKYSTGFFYPFFLIIRAGAYEGWRWRVAFDRRGIGEDSPEVARTAVEELEREAEQQPVELSETERKSYSKSERNV